MKIGVVGLGFVGLSLTSVLASKGISTLGIDIDRKKCKEIAAGNPPFFEPELKKTLRDGLKKNLIIMRKKNRRVLNQIRKNQKILNQNKLLARDL